MYGFKLSTAMDKLRQQSYSESLKTTLNCYQLSSADSLSGPSGYSALAAQLCCKANQQSPPNPPPPLIQIPLLMPNDTSTQTAEVFLGGERISCFIVGGEKRLCLPQILTTVLRDFGISEINRTCAELHIYCSRCSPDQLDILKVLKILPFNTTQCGLITKSDAERLVSTLGVEYHLNSKSGPDDCWAKSKGIKVYHECFGRGYGYFYPDLYVSPSATCIACMDCRITFSPSRFVAHSHHGLEKRTCHWGFDPENWRNYLLLSEDIDGSQSKDQEKQLNALKAKFDSVGSSTEFYNRASPTLKRRLAPESKLEHGKKIKEDKSSHVKLPSSAVPPMCLGFPLGLRPPAFKPFSGEMPLGLPTLAELRAAQEEAFLKALAPMVHNRRMLPEYLQSGPPAVIPPQTSASDWSSVMRHPPNITLAPVDQQKRTASYVLELERKAARERSCSSGSSGGRSYRRVTPPMKTEVMESQSMYPLGHDRPGSPASVYSRRAHDETVYHQSKKYVATSERFTENPICLKKSFLKSRFHRQNSPEVQEHPQNLSNGHHRSHDKENEIVDVITEDPLPLVKIRSKESEDVPSSLAVSSDVAAASAMLELSSSVKSTKRLSPSSPLVHTSSSVKSDVHRKSSSETDAVSHPVYPIVSATNHKHFKWTFSSASYIISASGSRELKEFQVLLDELKDESVKAQLIHEVVKMKFRHEDNLGRRDKLQRDVEMELGRLRTSCRQCIEDADNERRESNEEIERLRNEHIVRTKETEEALVELGRQLADLCLHPNSHDRELLQHKVLDQLQKRMDEREMANRLLEKQLREERDRRMEVERKLEKKSERSSHPPARKDEAVIRDFRKINGCDSDERASSKNDKKSFVPSVKQNGAEMSLPRKSFPTSHYSSKGRDPSPA